MNIQNNIPIPKSKVQQLRDMQVGDSFVVPDAKARQSWLSIARSTKIKVITRKENDEIRIWKAE